METLSTIQQQIFSHIQLTLQETGHSPSYREIAVRFSVSIGTVQYHLKVLQRKKYLDSPDYSHRSFRLLNYKPTLQVPVLGQVRAGLPILAEENIDSYLTVDQDVARGGKLFALKVVGDSMSGAGIYEKDIVLIRQQVTADSGQIVVAVKDGEATVKYFRHRGSQFLLEPANTAYKVMSAKGFDIIGTVVGLIRSYQR